MGSVEHVLSAGTIEGDDDKLEHAVSNMALTSLRPLAGQQAVIKTGTSRGAVWLAGAYGVINTAFTSSRDTRLFMPFTSKRAARFH